MGSLMAGWDSPVPDPISVKYRRNRSLTRGEIDAYWRLKKKTEDDHLRAISSLSSSGQDGADEDHGMKFQRSTSMPAASTREAFMVEAGAGLEHLIKKNGWWISSNSAFLNEPPVLERSSNSYTPQFHVASPATSESSSGISAQ
ncbi:DNA polymerase EPSILON CATALYTIC SUBUNIT A [Salix purpurea]|uniref:DNA polymerase EPSILON CATALYTIC SUBUNIT A n=1 Tax=Salix purpurea TaxID=77065 RepID=A0A9Q1AJL2_SALPP|nr:DNA polymerase EPSILON CATALYTIC SUBUNIT A [Salix purpurea]